jgi:hypothetical protein
MIERSRSGHGAHAWFFFEAPVPRTLARRLGSHLLTEAMERRPELGFDSYDRLFPNQDTMPQGGFGNLIALPLQASRDKGNSIFVDDNLDPWPDQWAFLASVQKLRAQDVEGLVGDAERRGRILGVRLPTQEDGFGRRRGRSNTSSSSSPRSFNRPRRATPTSGLHFNRSIRS